MNSQEEFLELANRLAEQSESFVVKHGRYLRWSSACGAEVWLQVDRRGELIGMTPHFSGSSVLRVGLTDRVIRPDATALDGAFRAWADPPDGNPAMGAYPFVFDVPDFLRYADAVVPGVAQAQVAAFAHEVSTYSTVEAYDASGVREPKFASQSFIPSGLFSPDGETTNPPEAHAIMTGHVRRSETLTNELTGASFFWAEVESLAAVFDVVIDSELVDTGPVIGGVISGSFWLSGCLPIYSKSRGAIWQRLFGRRPAG